MGWAGLMADGCVRTESVVFVCFFSSWEGA